MNETIRLHRKRSVAVVAQLSRPGLGDLLQRNVGLALVRQACPDAEITFYLSQEVCNTFGELAADHLLVDRVTSCPDPGASASAAQLFAARFADAGHDLGIIDVDSVEMSPNDLIDTGLPRVIAGTDAAHRPQVEVDKRIVRYQVLPSRPPLADLVDHARALASALGLPSPRPEKVVPPFPYRPINEAVEQFSATDRPLVVVHPGGARHWNRRWPARHFADLVERIISTGRAVTLVGGDDEREDLLALRRLVEARSNQGEEAPTIMTGRSLNEVASVVQSSTLFVGNDSAMSHVAAALRVPCLVVSGPSHGDYLWGRAYPTMRTLTLSFPCRGLTEKAFGEDRMACENRCGLRYDGPSTRSPECLEQLGVDLVWSSVQSALEPTVVRT